MTTSRQYCTFYLGDQCFGLDVLKVQEIVRYQPLTRVPRPEELEPVNVVVQTDDGAVSLLVDEIGDVLEVSEDQFERPPETLPGAARDLIQGANKLDNRLLVILDLEQVISLPIARN